ncbi:MAG: GTP cyclohydrolase I [Myxococcales bacterium]|nr:GTP cyclohydrolase I [Myxococcales bacterium]
MPPEPNTAAALAVEAFLDAIGISVDANPELKTTGRDVANAYQKELLAGYQMDPAAILKEFTSSASKAMVTLRDIAIFPVCPHHLLPSVGIAHLAYVPTKKVVGFGALGKLVQCFARRLVLQEDLVEQIAYALVTHLGASFAACTVDVVPLCIAARGLRAERSSAISTAYAGERASDPGLREEYFRTLSVASHRRG